MKNWLRREVFFPRIKNVYLFRKEVIAVVEKLMEQLNAWTYMNTLPQEMSGFTITIEREFNGTQYRLFSYQNEKRRQKFSVVYDKAAKEFLARWNIGLLEFCDVNFIAPEINALQRILEARLSATLHSMDVFDPASLGSVFINKKILDWPFAAELSPEIAGFSLFTRPTKPLKALNGSFVIIDYSDFTERTNLLIYYNIYRDDFYGELVFQGTPQMTTAFDTKSLAELEEKLKNNLEPVMLNMRQRLLQNDK
jgi:hypothetical protein